MRRSLPGTDTPAATRTVYSVFGLSASGTNTTTRLCVSKRPATAGVMLKRSSTPLSPSWLNVNSMPVSSGTVLL